MTEYKITNRELEQGIREFEKELQVKVEFKTVQFIKWTEINDKIVLEILKNNKQSILNFNLSRYQEAICHFPINPTSLKLEQDREDMKMNRQELIEEAIKQLN